MHHVLAGLPGERVHHDATTRQRTAESELDGILDETGGLQDGEDQTAGACVSRHKSHPTGSTLLVPMAKLIYLVHGCQKELVDLTDMRTQKPIRAASPPRHNASLFFARSILSVAYLGIGFWCIFVKGDFGHGHSSFGPELFYWISIPIALVTTQSGVNDALLFVFLGGMIQYFLLGWCIDRWITRRFFAE